MRYISKQTEQPACITLFIDQQRQARSEDPESDFPIDYGSFNAKKELTALLIAEQGGLCGYSGVGIDDGRLGFRRPPAPTHHWFFAHIEHLKAQSQCRRELEAQGKKPGMDLGEDMDYHNMIAALGVSGTAGEQFGAVTRGDMPLPLLPTDPNCEARFAFAADGSIAGTNQDSQECIRLLKLDHATLVDWRSSAIEAFVPDPLTLSDEAALQLAEDLNNPFNGRLVEFSFVIRSYVLSLLPPQSANETP